MSRLTLTLARTLTLVLYMGTQGSAGENSEARILTAAVRPQCKGHRHHEEEVSQVTEAETDDRSPTLQCSGAMPLDVGLPQFLARNNLTRIYVSGRKHLGDTHRWIHAGMFAALNAAAPSGIPVEWVSGAPPLPHSLVVTTIVSKPHRLAVASPNAALPHRDATSRYILLINEGKKAYTGMNYDWIRRITAVLWSPYKVIAPNHVKGTLLQPWPGPATPCGVITPTCIDEALLLQTAASQQLTAASRTKARLAVFVGTLWKTDQIQSFVTVVAHLRDAYNISTIQYGRCEPCTKDPNFATMHQFEARGILHAAAAADGVIERAFFTFDLRYDFHIRMKYVPDRWFKLASMGKLVVTNSESAREIFGDAVVAESDPRAMVDAAIALMTDQHKLRTALHVAAKIVRTEHTYAHRLRTLLTMFPQ